MDAGLVGNYFNWKISTFTDCSMMQNMMSPTISAFKKFEIMNSVMNEVTTVFWESKGVQELLASKEHYDVVITIAFFNDASLGLAHHLGASTILFSPIGSNAMTNYYFGNPTPLYVSCMIPFSDDLSFFARVAKVSLNFAMNTIFRLVNLPIQQKVLDKYLPDAPPLTELTNNISLLLVNSHYSYETPRPYIPNMVQIGGFHIAKPKALPEDIKTYLDEATEGAILFAMGSNVAIATFAEEKLNAILKTFASIHPMRVLFRSEIDLPNVPKNVKISKWIPQNDVLGHPHIKAFVTHGGLGSTVEAIYHGVPLLGIPMFGDQENNVHETTKAGVTLPLKYVDLTEETFSTALNELLKNPKYTENAKLKSALFRDQPIDPLDKAIFWVEHVIRFKGGAHLKNEGIKLTWYQNEGYDVFIFILSIFVIIVLISYKILKFVYVKLSQRIKKPKAKTS